jgi:Zn-finger nucleic acid-binding protein
MGPVFQRSFIMLREVVCPMCGTYMEIEHRHGVEIDRCPNCRGVWLDRGELEQVATRSGTIVEVPGTRPRAGRPADARKREISDGFEWF